jgi:hypothetical protein
LRNQRATPETDRVAQSCRRILDGVATSYDADIVRKFSGVHKSGTANIKGIQKGLRSTYNSFSNLSASIDIANSLSISGGNTTAANIRVINSVINETEKLFKNKLVKDGIKDVAKLLGSSPSAASAFVRSLGTAIKLGGTVAGMALGAYEVADSYFGNKKSGYKSDLDSTNALWNLNSNSSNAIRKYASSRVLESRGVFSRVRDSLGFDSTTKNKIKEEILRATELQKSGRANIGNLGFNRDDLLNEKAAQIGKSVQDLSEREINTALDDALGADRAGGVLDYTKFLNSDFVNNKINANKRAWWTQVDYENARREYANEQVSSLVNRAQKHREDLSTYADNERKIRSEDPVESVKYREQVHNTESDFANFRSRHAAHNPD